MLSPFPHEESMATAVALGQGNMDVSSASDAVASSEFKAHANLDPNSLPPYPASLNQVPFFVAVIVIIIKGQSERLIP